MLRTISSLFQVAATLALLTNLPVRAADEPSNPPVLARIGERMEALVRYQEISGTVTLVTTADRIVHLEANGLANIANHRPMRPDTIFWIASMTKPTTATAIMMLQEEGKLSVEDLVSKYIPEFAGLKTVDGKPARITIRHLLTHTSGLAEFQRGQARKVRVLAEAIPCYIDRPVRYEPGSKWVYCQSGINTAGRIIEIASGTSLDRFLEERLFGPLGMKDTGFYLNDEQASRVAMTYEKKDGKLIPTEEDLLAGRNPTHHDRFPAANGGLYSTAPDYARFCQMILNHGELDGRRYLKPETVKQMTSLQTGNLETGFTPGNGWGLGWCVVRHPQGITSMLSPGSFGHGGAFGTQAWIDPVKKRVYVLMIQRSNIGNSDRSAVRQAFQEEAASVLGSQ